MKIYLPLGRQWYLAETAATRYTMMINWCQRHRTCSVPFRFKSNDDNIKSRVCSARSRGRKVASRVALVRWQFWAQSTHFKSLTTEWSSIKRDYNNKCFTAHRSCQCKWNFEGLNAGHLGVERIKTTGKDSLVFFGEKGSNTLAGSQNICKIKRFVSVAAISLSGRGK